MSRDDGFMIHPSSSQDALDVLVSAGMEQRAPKQILQLIPGQSPRRECDKEQSSVEPSDVSRASFETRMMAMMEGFSQRLNDLTARVESHEGAATGGTSTEAPPSTPSSSQASRTCNYRCRLTALWMSHWTHCR